MTQANLHMPPSELIPEFSVCHCDQLATIHCRGPEAASFLHGQLSNDIEGLATDESTLAAYCNPKGRVIATIRVIRLSPEHFILVLAKNLVEPVTKRLNMFILRAKVKLEASNELDVLGIPATQWVRDRFGHAPEPGKSLWISETSCLLNVGVHIDRFLLLAGVNDAAVKDIRPIDIPGGWLSIQSLDAIPEVFAETSEQFLPQALNLDLVGGVNFRKGCYPGQEIVARLRYLGKLKQRMLRVSFKGPAKDMGCAVFGDEKVGQLVLSGPGQTPGNWLGLVSVNFKNLDETGMSFEDGTVMSLFHPNYTVPELTQNASD